MHYTRLHAVLTLNCNHPDEHLIGNKYSHKFTKPESSPSQECDVLA